MASPETQTHFVDIVSGVDSLIYIAASAFTVWVVLSSYSPPTPQVLYSLLCVCLSAIASPKPPVLVLKLVDRALGVPAGTSA